MSSTRKELETAPSLGSEIGRRINSSGALRAVFATGGCGQGIARFSTKKEPGMGHARLEDSTFCSRQNL